MDSMESDWISTHLDHLHDNFEGFPFQQITVSVDPDEFRSARERGNVADVRVRITGPEGTVGIGSGDETVHPGGTVESTRPLSAAAVEFASRQSGVEFDIEGVRQASLVCIKDRSTDAQVHQLSVVFDASYANGTLVDGAVWRDPETVRSPAT